MVHITHQGESRGLKGISWPTRRRAQTYALHRHATDRPQTDLSRLYPIGRSSIIPSYRLPILSKRHAIPYTDHQRRRQLLHWGRHVDLGTEFGLSTPSDVLEMRPRSHSVRGTPRTQCAPRSTSTSYPSRSLLPSSSQRRYMSMSLAHQIVHTSRGSTGGSSTTSTYRPRPRLHHPFIRMRGGVVGSHHLRNRAPYRGNCHMDVRANNSQDN